MEAQPWKKLERPQKESQGGGYAVCSYQDEMSLVLREKRPREVIGITQDVVN